MKYDKKVFGIGLEKTGLTSLLALMISTGLDARGTERAMRRKFFLKKDYKGILDYYDSADFFCDWPTPLMYKPAFRKYGDKSRFILTVRRDSQTCFESVKRHNRYAHPILNKHRWYFGRYYPHGFDDEHKAYYENHTHEILDFFNWQDARKQLLVLQVDDKDAIERISSFLELEIELKSFPRRNVSLNNRGDIGSKFKLRYNKIVQPIYKRLAPRFRRGKPRQPCPIDLDFDARRQIGD